MSTVTSNDKFAESILEGVLAFDRPLSQLMEIVLAMSEGRQRAAIKECSGELLRHQFYLIERITTAYPELDKVVESSLPAFSSEVWEKIGR